MDEQEPRSWGEEIREQLVALQDRGDAVFSEVWRRLWSRAERTEKAEAERGAAIVRTEKAEARLSKVGEHLGCDRDGRADEMYLSGILHVIDTEWSHESQTELELGDVAQDRACRQHAITAPLDRDEEAAYRRLRQAVYGRPGEGWTAPSSSLRAEVERLQAIVRHVVGGPGLHLPQDAVDLQAAARRAYHNRKTTTEPTVETSGAHDAQILRDNRDSIAEAMLADARAGVDRPAGPHRRLAIDQLVKHPRWKTRAGMFVFDPEFPEHPFRLEGPSLRGKVFPDLNDTGTQGILRDMVEEAGGEDAGQVRRTKDSRGDLAGYRVSARSPLRSNLDWLWGNTLGDALARALLTAWGE
jgi:hypothetical protein